VTKIDKKISGQLPGFAAGATHAANQIHCVTNFRDLVSTPFPGEMNAICWTRKLTGDFSEIANKAALNGNMVALDPDALLELRSPSLSQQVLT